MPPKRRPGPLPPKVMKDPSPAKIRQRVLELKPRGAVLWGVDGFARRVSADPALVQPVLNALVAEQKLRQSGRGYSFVRQKRGK